MLNGPQGLKGTAAYAPSQRLAGEGHCSRTTKRRPRIEIGPFSFSYKDILLPDPTYSCMSGCDSVESLYSTSSLPLVFIFIFFLCF